MSFTEINLTIVLETTPLVVFEEADSETSPIIPVIVPKQ